MKAICIIFYISLMSCQSCSKLNQQDDNYSIVRFGPNEQINKEVELKIIPNLEKTVHTLQHEVPKLKNCQLFIYLNVYEEGKVTFINSRPSCDIDSIEIKVVNNYFSKNVGFSIITKQYRVMNKSTKITFPINF